MKFKKNFILKLIYEIKVKGTFQISNFFLTIRFPAIFSSKMIVETWDLVWSILTCHTMHQFEQKFVRGNPSSVNTSDTRKMPKNTKKTEIFLSEIIVETQNLVWSIITCCTMHQFKQKIVRGNPSSVNTSGKNELPYFDLYLSVWGIKCCIVNGVDSESERILTIGPSQGQIEGWWWGGGGGERGGAKMNLTILIFT